MKMVDFLFKGKMMIIKDYHHLFKYKLK